MTKFFIDRPVFAWVIAIIIVLAGLVTLRSLPVAQYPSVAAPTIQITTTYPGASAQVHEQTVLTIIEREMNGVEGLDYMNAKAGSNGRGSITLTFKSDVDVDIAQVDVQNRLARAEPSLPQVVRQYGVQVNKSQSNFLMVVSMLATENSSMSVDEIGDYVARNIQPELQRLDGVGNVQVFASEQAMRIWLDPNKMRGYGLSINQVKAALMAQNTQIPAGMVGGEPTTNEQTFTATITADGQLQTAEEFEQVILTNLPSGATVRLKDVADVALGQSNYSFSSRVNGKLAVAMGVSLSNDGNAIAVAEAVYSKMDELAQYFPKGIEWMSPYDSSIFIDISINKVFKTLFEALGLVFLVMFLFLQNIRYTFIPAIVVPVSLLGAVALMGPLGMSINVLTMFAMVLVIGIVVDDAIIVVENVERLMEEEGLNPYEAARKTSDQISGAIVGITIVLISVFIPMTFFPGATGNIYRQFSLVMAISIAFSGFLALTLTPALCATMLNPITREGEKKGFLGWFNRSVTRSTKAYEKGLAKLIRRSYFMMVVYVVLTVGAVFMYLNLSSSFLPSEDQGSVIVSVQLPSGATLNRTDEVLRQVESIVLAQPEVDNMVGIMGFSFSGQGPNMALAFVTLKDWSERTEPDQQAAAVAGRLSGMFAQKVRGAMAFAINPPPIMELGVSAGFDVVLQDRAGLGHGALVNARNQFLGGLSQDDRLANVRPQGLEDAQQLRLNIDRNAAAVQGVSLQAIAETLSAQLGSSYVNDFPNKGRMQRVTIMAKAGARMQPEDVLALTVPNNKGELVSLGSILSIDWDAGPMQLTRYNGYPSMALTGEPAKGLSTGEAMQAVSEIAQNLPDGFGITWTGQSLEEIRSGSQSTILYAFSVITVFLILAALYESWSIPLAVVLVVPLGFLGVVIGVTLRGMDNDIYFQVGLLTVMGLSAKNAILIIEFAKDLQAEGRSRVAAALDAAHLRFRPILMTSIAFVAGVIPLFFASGASSASQRAIGTAVLSGMAIGTLLSVILVPIYYVVVRKIFKGGKRPHERFKPTKQVEESEQLPHTS